MFLNEKAPSRHTFRFINVDRLAANALYYIFTVRWLSADASFTGGNYTIQLQQKRFPDFLDELSGIFYLEYTFYLLGLQCGKKHRHAGGHSNFSGSLFAWAAADVNRLLAVLSFEKNCTIKLEFGRIGLFLDRVRIPAPKLGPGFPLDDAGKRFCGKPSMGAMVRIYGRLWRDDLDLAGQYFDISDLSVT